MPKGKRKTLILSELYCWHFVESEFNYYTLASPSWLSSWVFEYWFWGHPLRPLASMKLAMLPDPPAGSGVSVVPIRIHTRIHMDPLGIRQRGDSISLGNGSLNLETDPTWNSCKLGESSKVSHAFPASCIFGRW